MNNSVKPPNNEASKDLLEQIKLKLLCLEERQWAEFDAKLDRLLASKSDQVSHRQP